MPALAAKKARRRRRAFEFSLPPPVAIDQRLENVTYGISVIVTSAISPALFMLLNMLVWLPG